MTDTNFRLVFAAVISTVFPDVHAHDLFESWDADATPIACLMGAVSGWERDEKYGVMEPGPVTVRVYVATFHPGVENPLTHIAGLDSKTIFVKLQVITSISMRAAAMSVSRVEVMLGTEAVSPILDPTWEDDSLPIAYLGGNEASRFVEMLEKAISPVISVTLSDSSTIKISISTKGFKIARAMMNTCQQEISNAGPA